MTNVALCAATAAALMLPVSTASAQQFVNAGTPTPECTMVLPDVQFPEAYGVKGEPVWPGYIAKWDAGEQCIPFMQAGNFIPADYAGKDYYADEFTDSRLRERLQATWRECQQDPDTCSEPDVAAVKNQTRFQPRRTGTVDSFGDIDEEGDVDLADIRRPGYFGKDPFAEPIAVAEPNTYTVEFAAPREGFEREHLGLTDPIKLRGWYMQGEGVDDGNGQKVRALMVISQGGGSEFTAIGHRNFELDQATGKYVVRNHGLKNEQAGAYNWRLYVHAFYAAGFDVLIVDRRGNGISGGRSSFNVNEQANDIFRILGQLETGQGLRILTPQREVLEGATAARIPLGGLSPKDLPTVLFGYSRGSSTTQWFMHKNFVENCNYDSREPTCEPAVGLQNVKGAIVGGANPSGMGYGFGPEIIREPALRTLFNTVNNPDGSVLKNLDKWPGLQIIKGTFDRVEGLEGSLDAYRRLRGLKDIAVFPGQHGTNGYPPDMLNWIAERMVAFATAAVLGHDKVAGSVEPSDLRDLVLSSPQFWEMGMSRDGWQRIQ